MATQGEVMKSMQRTLKVCSEILRAKGQNYAGGDKDRLKNFKEGAQISALQGKIIEQKQVLWGYLLKHLTSINYMCRMHKQKPDRAQWDEKICDAINYLLLLSAMVDEEIRQEITTRYPSNNWQVRTQKTPTEELFVEEVVFGEIYRRGDSELQQTDGAKGTD